MLVFPLLNIQKILCTLTYKDEGLYFPPPQTCKMFPSGAEAAFVQWMNVGFFSSFPLHNQLFAQTECSLLLLCGKHESEM